ncbi:putative Tetratricopeptide repeat (TPR)-like superfamily protein [Hibiscus syriacus]|uniref:Tetratricopeptide repeat (TPR)-like superfamily protein n=1 Tax=Hibiscus syriacus TaxID=106335 RepID=A0A6A3AA95_HIBSY|nr:putative Tetratricopeptide repeat (TPR)-like superfamily protein [Hibiscus syriacus]
MLPRRLTSAVEWEALSEGVQVRFKTRYGQYLRANGRFPPWMGHITHDIPHRSITQDWILWNVEILEHRDDEPLPRLLPPPVDTSSSQHPINKTNIESNSDDHASPSQISLRGPIASTLEPDNSTEGSLAAFEGRVIKYEVVDKNGDVDAMVVERSFTFKGSGVVGLKKMLKEETGVDEEFTICSRNPLNGKLYPLRLHLPPNNSAMHVVVAPQSSTAAKDLGSS